MATRDRAGRYSDKISKQCTNCNVTETDTHLFFHCSFARAVWFSANPSLCTSFLPTEQDGVQEILPLILNGNTTDDHLQATMTILWYIWKARNDLRFNSKKWTVWQVHSCTAEEIRTSNLSMNAVDQQHMPKGMNASLADPQMQSTTPQARPLSAFQSEHRPRPKANKLHYTPRYKFGFHRYKCRRHNRSPADAQQ